MCLFPQARDFHLLVEHDLGKIFSRRDAENRE